ncbi:ATP-binding protein [Chlorogloeopsis fritschii PCC 9212]|uniref:histidine kinase n=1 Tax=Chlorogloeopsis fritschii PCC 6912 TaxID=211165 RepID=A0A3S1FL33_CHLFR|nr:ATP-binding protein [Chlorogloeopsis fritschii]RUR80804.1 hybrid sensor histidine kinase/response regulator [Chlorogloeopsis fritschii PCC 6912]
MMNKILRFLIIDDNPGDRTLVIRELRREFPQLQVQEIKEAAGFAQAVAAGEFDLVITDYQLGWSNGLEILRTIKQHYPNCPTIMFTNTGNEEIAVEAMKTGLDDYVLKLPNRYYRLPTVVKAALERAEMQRRVALLEIRLQGLLNQLKVGVFRANSAGELLECNRVFLNLLHVDSLATAQRVQLLNLQAIYLQLSSLPPPQQDEHELQLHRADGTTIWILLSTVLSTINGETVVDGLIEDITDRKQAETQLRQLASTLEERVRERTQELETANRDLAALNRQLELANQDLEEFVYSVSHDFRAPLRAIQGFSEILLERQIEQLSSNYQNYLRRIVENARHLDRLAEELLTYSQLSRAQMPLQPINLSLFVAQILRRLEPELQQQQATVQVEEPLAEVMGNRIVLEQVVINLLTNAIKFVAPGVKPQIRMWTQEVRNSESERQENSFFSPSPYPPISPSSPFVRLWIQDNGIGIAEDNFERIFKVFERLHGSEVYPGTGIGLAIVRKGVERMGGRVGLESELGQGSRFWIELPKATGGE